MMTPLNILGLTQGRIFTPDQMKRHLGYPDAAAAPGTLARIAGWLGRRIPGKAHRASERAAKG